MCLISNRENLKFIIAILCCWATSLSAQNVVFQNLSVLDGLPDYHVKSIIQDSSGFIWFGTQNGLARYDGYEFKIFKNEPGNPESLSDNGIWVLCEGRSGCLWIGTQNGDLDRYDFRKNIFEHRNICGSKAEGNYISCLHEDEKGNIWIGTYNKGLYRFNPSGKSVEHWLHSDNDGNSLSNDFVNAIVSDDEGNLWIGTYSGLNKFNPSAGSPVFEKYFADKTNPNSLTDNLIWNITRSRTDPAIFYISTYRGLTIFDTKTRTFRKLLPLKHPENQFSNSIGSVVEKKSATGTELWLGGYGGLIKYDMLTKDTHQWHHNHKNPQSLISDRINDMLKDRSGVLWIATEDGVSRLSEKILKFGGDALRNFSASDREAVNELEIGSLAQSNGFIFLGTSQGLKYISFKNGKSRLVPVHQFDGINIWSLSPGNSNDLWIGTYGKGLYHLNLTSFKSEKINFRSPTDRITPYNYVKSVYEDTRGRLWAGFWGGGLAVLNTKTGEKKIFRKESGSNSSISYNDVWKICRDGFGRIWIGTYGGGLNLYDDRKGDAFYKISGAELKIIHNNILSICEQKNNLSNNNSTVLWIGTTDGLLKLEIRNIDEFKDINEIIINSKNYTEKDGLANGVVSDIVEDNAGNLWLATNYGLTEFIADSEKFINFSTDDGLTGNNFSTGDLLKTRSGEILAGNNRGLNIFNPENIKLSNYQPQIVFTGFLIRNKPADISDNSPLKQDISYTEEITLDYNQNTFTFYYSSPDYNATHLIDYAYLMEGFDKEWILPGRRNYASYTNLDPGKYVFKVKATNSDKVWNDTPAEISIIINPPWWKTSWAYSVYIFLILAGLTVIRKFQISRVELRNELKMREFEARKLQELESLKSRFFANLSHEFRTPLMLIKGPVEQLIENYAKQKHGRNGQEEQLRIIQRNSSKLQGLIDQLLELSQLEAASIPLKTKYENLTVLLKGIVNAFGYIAEQKNIEFNLACGEEILSAWVDRDKFEKIINNLLSNAFKFTRENGKISVSLGPDKKNANAVIRISDTGIGIPEDKLERIFDRFYQADDSSRKVFGGSGIGLALVKELVELHKWEISVKSEVDKGTEFTLSVPLGGSYLDEGEKELEENSGNENPVIQNGPQAAEVAGVKEDSVVKEKSGETNSSGMLSILIVDDSADVRKYLSDVLKSFFESNKIIPEGSKSSSGIKDSLSFIQKRLVLWEAANGESGLKTAAEQMPDLIISDIMMPHMDGIEFCQKIKTDWETSHIPVILLTAKASAESKIEGLETGADDYLTKPFDSRELYVRVKNLLEQRRRLKDKFSKEIKIDAEDVTTTSLDNEFLSRAVKIAEENISDAGFDSEAFAKEMFVSRSQLHRKLLAVTGRAPGEFLRLMRLKHAAKLLLENRYSVTQIALESGFNSPSHFTKAFRQQFNCLPSEFTGKGFGV